MNKVFITGVSGFIGRNLARHFSRKGHSVFGVDSSAEENAPIADLARYYQTRLPTENLGPILSGLKPDLCFHCAGRASVGLSVTEPRTDFYSGPVLTWEILDTIRLNAPDCRFIFLSSAAVYGSPQHLPIDEAHPLEPISPYGFHKWQSEIICKEFANMYGMRVASARIFSAYGPGLRRQVVWDLFHQALTRCKINAQGDGSESRDFIQVSDLCSALEIISEKGVMQGEAYNVASGEEITIAHLVRLVKESLASDCKINFSGDVPLGTPANWRADVSSLRSLGFSPKITMEVGMKAFGTWCRAELGVG